jgi:hypothetical protein
MHVGLIDNGGVCNAARICGSKPACVTSVTIFWTVEPESSSRTTGVLNNLWVDDISTGDLSICSLQLAIVTTNLRTRNNLNPPAIQQFVDTISRPSQRRTYLRSYGWSDWRTIPCPTGRLIVDTILSQCCNRLPTRAMPLAVWHTAPTPGSPRIAYHHRSPVHKRALL